jgi:hypothetical protein
MVEKIKFDKYVKQLKHFTKKNEYTWFVQKHRHMYMESFYVTILPHGLCMSGDQHHKEKEYTEKSGEQAIINIISSFCDMDDLEDLLREQLWHSKINDEQFKETVREKIAEIDNIPIEDVDEKQLDKLIAVRNTVAYHSLENECEYWDLCKDLESEHDFSDLWERNQRFYTIQLKWQHLCLLWWDNNVIDKQDKESFDVKQKTSPIPLTDKSVSILGGIL